jgi:membrane protein YdbS with pleckstrin-like domain
VPIPQRLLTDDEEVLVDVHPHWVVFAGPLVLTGVAMAVAIAAIDTFPKAPVAAAWVLAAMVVVPASWTAARVVRWRATSLVVTDQRLLLTRGIMRRDLVQLRRERIADVHCRRSLFEQLIGSGRLVLEVVGDDALYIDDVRRPRALQRVLTDHVIEPGRPSEAMVADDTTWPGHDITPPEGVPLAPVVSGGDTAGDRVHQRLVELDDLRRRGILTDAEFAAKKAELLSRL